ncbi:hypothetical protein B0F90DRAFT_1911917 [Multifurca ochricompacta]|uniref:Zn(2)-C6 fungal-type domain-containing protein n=1 Tax=Multifurca ochricompacta TaxID=376703 RepID=A0AAD4QNM2_9AGAM|nr:hypothetical protein B0F90DRAFT_1911917 [Multifurca ochricompacta]
MNNNSPIGHSPTDTSGSISQQAALALPSPSVQNQIHELAKTLPPPRKQNIACDACRQRKVKCHQLPGQSKCQHCMVKNYPCTHHAQQATSEKKRISTVSRRPRAYTTNAQQSPRTPEKPSYLVSPAPPSPQPTLSPYSQATFGPPVRRNTSFTDLLAYLLSPPDEVNDVDGYQEPTHRINPWKDWGEVAYKLQDEHFRIEFALDLVEVYFQVVHTRLPFLNPTHFRARLNQFSCTRRRRGGPLHPALMATVVAWGAKFSEHPLLVADRLNSSSRQSSLAKTLIVRAREVAEALKVHRVPAAEHVVIALLIEPLQSRTLPIVPSLFPRFWLTSAIRQLFDLQINHKSVISNIQDPEARGTMIFAWWMACLSDAYGAAYYRRKPQVEDDDYDVDFYTVDPVSMDSDGQAKPDPREHLEFLGYYRAAHALARISRHMSKNLWIPTTDSEGVPVEVLRGIMHQLNEWRVQYLPRVGVPTDFAAEWDFVSAVSACASDATFHIMWIILFNALDDRGIRESLGSPHSTALGLQEQIEELKIKVLEEALHGAMRIAGLAGVPAVMHVSCNYAGVLLARFGRPEVQNCIEGLEQYSYSYEEAADQAQELHRLFTLARAGQTDFAHMASTELQVSPPTQQARSLAQPPSPVGLGNGIYPDARTF